MTKTQAYEKALDILYAADKPFSSEDILLEGERIFSESIQLKKNLNSYDSLSGKRVVNHMRSRIKQPTVVIGELYSQSCAEFLSEYWITLDDMKSKIIATEVYNKIRDRVCR